MMKLHLLTCDRCERYLGQLRFLKRTLRGHSEELADPERVTGSELREASKERMKEILAVAAQSQP